MISNHVKCNNYSIFIKVKISQTNWINFRICIQFIQELMNGYKC